MDDIYLNMARLCLDGGLSHPSATTLVEAMKYANESKHTPVRDGVTFCGCSMNTLEHTANTFWIVNGTRLVCRSRARYNINKHYEYMKCDTSVTIWPTVTEYLDTIAVSSDSGHDIASITEILAKNDCLPAWDDIMAKTSSLPKLGEQRLRDIRDTIQYYIKRNRGTPAKFNGNYSIINGTTIGQWHLTLKGYLLGKFTKAQAIEVVHELFDFAQNNNLCICQVSDGSYHEATLESLTDILEHGDKLQDYFIKFRTGNVKMNT